MLLPADGYELQHPVSSQARSTFLYAVRRARPHPREISRLTQYSEEFEFEGRSATLTYWHRPLHAMTDAFIEADFRIAAVSEPPWSPDTPAELLPPNASERTAFVCFLFFALEAA